VVLEIRTDAEVFALPPPVTFLHAGNLSIGLAKTSTIDPVAAAIDLA
jgi:hypothetical protein